MPSSLIPSFFYRDAPRAIDWLCDAFGLERHLVVEGEGGRIDHAELTCGTGMLMLGSAREEGYGEFITTVAEAGKATCGVYLVLADVDAHAARARAAGAEILREPEDQPYGGRLYSCRDLEGNVWSFGSYDPWTGAEV